MSAALSDRERRIAPRRGTQLRVDLKVLPPREVEGILEGAGYDDLSVRAIALSKPRSGMTGGLALDLSNSGMGVAASGLAKGMAAAIDLHLPGQRTVVKLLGEVIWAGGEGAQARAGLRIAALDLDSAERVRRFLQEEAA